MITSCRYVKVFDPLDYTPPGICQMGGQKGPSYAQGPPQTTTTKVEPWEGLVPYLTEAMGMAQTAAHGTSTTPYGGELYAGPNATQQAANQARIQLAQGSALGDVGGQAIKLAGDTLAGTYLTPDSNPYFKAGLQATVRPMVENLKYDVLPQLTSDAWNAGAYGGDRYNIEQGRRISQTEQNIADTSAKAYADLYTRERQNQINAPALAQAGNAISLMPSDIMAAAGAEQQGWDQQALNAAYQKYQMAQQAPWAAVTPYAQILQGLPLPGGSTTQTGTPGQFYQGTSQGANMLSGAMGGASMGASLAPLLGMAGPWGAVAGGIGGLLLGGL